MPALSVLMPVRDGLPYLPEALRSILGQSLSDFELLVLDDGSRDGSLELARRAAERDGRIRVVALPRRGIVAALNDGLARASAPLVARMDADDVALPRRLELQAALLRARPEVGCVGGFYETIDHRGRRLLLRDDLPLDDEGIQGQLLRGNTVICHPAAMLRRAAALEAGGYDPSLQLAEDLDLWLRIGERWRLANVPAVVLRYRQWLGCASARAHSDQLDQMRRACEQAWRRRGIAGEFANRGWLPTSRRGRWSAFLWAGEIGLDRGEPGMALAYAARALCERPLALEGWRLAARAAGGRGRRAAP